MKRHLFLCFGFLLLSLTVWLLATFVIPCKKTVQPPTGLTGPINILSENNSITTSSPSFNIAHISDTHCPNHSLKDSLCKIQDVHPAFVVHTGDIVNDDRPGSFVSYIDTVKSISGATIYHTAGNRDTSSGKRPESYLSYFGLPQYYVDVNNDWRLVFIRSDSLEIKPEDIDWLKKVLSDGKKKNRRLLLFTHCPPYNLIFRLIQYHCLKQENSEQLANALKGYDVAGLFCGHIHMSGSYDWNGVPVYYSDFLTGYNFIQIAGRAITVKQIPFVKSP